MNPTILSVLSGMAAAVWSVWTWQSERQKVRELKRDEMSAQYVNNLIVVTQELQRRLFNILERDELAQYRLKYEQPVEPASPLAIDLLFYLSVFFGWEHFTFRFGPYTRDSKMISMMAQIGETIDSRSRFPGDAFRFSLSDRHALGLAVVRRVGDTSSGPAFMNITRFKFEEEMLDEHSEWARLFRSEAVRCTLSAIDRAIAGEALEGRERLAVLQNLLVDSLSYLEEQEGFRVSFGERARATRESDLADATSQDNRDIRILHQMPGRIRLGIPRLHGDSIYASHLQLLLQALDHVKSVRVNINAACVVVEYSDHVPLVDFMHRLVALVETNLDRTLGNDDVQPSIVSTSKRSNQSATTV